ncbi:MAG: 4-hydroxybenzoate octaprenyltransferase [Mariprofundales bacterium]|nr:4-hydroxybenzoate octaprenyltransferase [Mariprofundales bacterium]
MTTKSDVIKANPMPPISLPARLHAYGRLMRVDKPIGTWLVLWPALWALWIAGEGHPDGYIVVIFVAGAFLMRSAGCVINDFADRAIDPLVERTKERPLANGELSGSEAVLLSLLLLVVAGTLVLLLNRLTIILAVVAAVLAALYPFTKRWTYLPQLFLALAFAWAIPMAFAALCGELPAVAWLLLAADMAWVTAYDTIYAMVDRGDDVKIGVKSTAILFADWDRHVVALLYSVSLLLLIAVGVTLDFGWSYFSGVAAALLLFCYQLWLIRDRDRERCFTAFLNNHWVGLLLFCGLFVEYAT